MHNTPSAQLTSVTLYSFGDRQRFESKHVSATADDAIAAAVRQHFGSHAMLIRDPLTSDETAVIGQIVKPGSNGGTEYLTGYLRITTSVVAELEE